MSGRKDECYSDLMDPQSPLPQRRSIRLKDYDYAMAGAYFVTICAHQRRCLFGRIAEFQMRQNAFGSIVEEEWFRSAKIRRSIMLDAFVVMPNHVHGIVIIGEQNGGTTGRSPDRSAGPARGSLGSFIGNFKAAVSRRIGALAQAPDSPVWQRNYYEHIVRSDRELEQIREYIVLSPAQWANDRQNPARLGAAKPTAVWDR
jgi:putative transposase